MSYTALYRKWRPKSFEDVIGQDHIVKTLTNQIVSDRIAHAYLFCGTRGTGKTSTAKIFAKAINCMTPVEGNPCNECEICNDINEGNTLNIIEIDAASNNGVDNIRDIREEVRYTPTKGKYKVYIIDEVHMLSIGAFNALLKTLEEPPSYVVFILATTEPHKIPITILSRCQRYDFKRISIDTISDELTKFMLADNIEVESKAIRYVSQVADGSMRDALSILDQCISFFLGETLTLDKVLDILGAVDTALFIELIQDLQQSDVKSGIQFVDDLITGGRDIAQFITDFTWFLRSLLIVKTVKEPEVILDMSSENIISLKEVANIVEKQQIYRYIRIFSELANSIKYESAKRVMLEVALIKICEPSMDNHSDGLIDRIKTLEEKIKNGVQVQQITQVDIAQKKTNEIKKVPKQPMDKAVAEDLKKVLEKWKNIIQSMPISMKPYLKKTYLDMSEDTLIIMCTDELVKGFLENEERKEALQQGLNSFCNKVFDIQYKVDDSADDTSQVSNENIEEELQKMINFDITYEE